MARAIWTGTVSFGLVSIPVKLFNATAPKDVRFHQFDRESGRRVRYRRIAEGGGWEGPGALPGEGSELRAPAEAGPEGAGSGEAGSDEAGPEGAGRAPEPAPEPRPGFSPGPEAVAFQDLVKGYEVDPGRFVMVAPEELEALRPEQSRTIDIEHFVDLEDIDPVYFERSYYLAPQRGAGAEKPYALLLAAMERAGKVGVGRFVLRSKEYLAAIRPVRGILGLETMFYDDEVRTADDIDIGSAGAGAAPSGRELEVAVRLIELLATGWDPTRYQDEYRQRVLDLIEGKLQAEGLHVQEEPALPAATAGVTDLMAALKASVEAAKAHAEPKPDAKRGTRKDSGEAARPRRRRTG
jgi:DNA end-binding protein Ku